MEEDLKESLATLKKGEAAVIQQIDDKVEGTQRRRLLDLGIVSGAEIRYLYDSPIGSTKAFEVYGTVVALRRDQYNNIYIRQKNK